MANENTTWKTVDDAKVRHIWRDSNGEEHAIPPTFYAELGTPIEGEEGNDGDDMVYVRTEIAE